MKKLGINECKAIMLEILKDFKHFCNQKGLSYSLFGGTLLGAVRHGGFIPWDDDVDVAMPRDDYERFYILFKESFLSEKYKLYNSESMPDYPYPFLKLADSNTVIQGVGNDSRFEMGLHIDIFPLDGFSRVNWVAKWQFRFHFMLRQFAVLSSLHVHVKNRSLCKIIFLFFFKVFTLGVRPRFWHRISNWVAKRRKLFSTSLAGNCVWGIGTQEAVSVEIFRKYKDIIFENEIFSAFEDTDGYLKGIYGDYMTPPPIEKQVGMHTSAVYMK